jgi:hypothetical protein
MPRLSIKEKEQIKNLSHAELQQIVLKINAKEQSVYDFVLMNYLDNESGEEELFENTKADLDLLFCKNYKGYAEELKLANMLTACIKRINKFTIVSKNKVLEADLLVYILEVPFSLSTDLLGTCFTQYDTKVALIVKRLITLVTKKLHEDYRIEYVKKINSYLQILHRTSNHIDTIYCLPKTI